MPFPSPLLDVLSQILFGHPFGKYRISNQVLDDLPNASRGIPAYRALVHKWLRQTLMIVVLGALSPQERSFT